MSSTTTASIVALKDRLEILPTRGGRPTPLFQLAVTLWIVFTVVCGVKAIVSPVKHNSYDAFQAGGELWLADMNMYKGTHHEFRYGPTFAFLFAPLAVLPLAVGSLIWMCFSIIVLFRSLRLLVREILPGEWTANQEAVFLMLVLPAAYRGLWTAQTNALIFACLVVALHAILERRWTWAALFLALPVHIKIWPVAAALLLIVCWPRQLAARFVAVMLAVAALPLLAKWPSVVAARYAEWYASIVGPMQIRHTYRDMWTVIEAFFPPLESAYLVLQMSTALLVLALCIWQKQKQTSTPQLLTFILAIWASWQLTFGPGTERATFGLVAPLTAWGLITSFRVGHGRVVMVLAFTLTILGGTGQLERALMPIFPLVTTLHPIGVLIFGAWLVSYARVWQTVRGEAPVRSWSYSLRTWAQAT